MDDSEGQRKRRGDADDGVDDGKDDGKDDHENENDESCDNENLIAAMNHKLRRHMLRRLNRAEHPLSPANLSDRMEVPIGNVSYHMGVLRKCGAVSMADQRRVRGAVEHFFVSEVADHPAVQALLEETKAEDEGLP